MVTTLAGTAGTRGIEDGAGVEARFTQPRWITNDGTHLYVTDYNTVRKIEIATGVVTTLAGQATAGDTIDGVGSDARFNYPFGITSDGIYLYIAEWGSSVIRKIHSVTGEVTTVAGTPNVRGFIDGTGAAALFTNPTDVATDGTSLYVTDTGNDVVRKIDIETGVVTTVIGSTDSNNITRLFAPMGIAMSNEYIYVTDLHSVRRISIESGSATTIAGGASDYSDGKGNQALFNTPKGITLVGSELYLADTENHVIRKITDIDLPNI